MKRIPTLLIMMALSAVCPCAQTRELKIGIMPDADSLPLMVAEAGALYGLEGVNVRLIRFQNPVERDAAFQAGVVDAIIGDILGAALAVQGGYEIRITSLTDGRYGIVTGPDSGIDSLADLAGKPIGLSTNTVIQYMVDTFMTRAGVPAGKISGIAVPRMPIRLEMVLGGQTAGAGLPEPLLTMATTRGGKMLASTDDSGLRAGVLLFSRKSADTMQAEIRAFYKAYWKAAKAINADNEAYRSFLVQKAGFPAEVAEVYRFVRYEKPRLPRTADIVPILSWMTSRGLLKITIDPESLLDGRALAGW